MEKSSMFPGQPRTVFKNSIFVLIARGVDVGGGILLIWLSARYLVKYFGIEVNGEYVYLATLVGLAFTLANAGLAQIIIRDVARNRELAPDYLASALVLRVLLGLLAVILLLGVAFFTSMPPQLKWGLLVAMAAEFGNVIAWNYINLFNAFEHMEYEAYAAILFRLFCLAGTGLVILFKLHWLVLFLVTGIGAYARLFYVIQLSKKLAIPAGTMELSRVKTLFLEALPIGIALLLTQGYLRVDVILLKVLSNFKEVALFYYPYRILLELHILPLALTTALFPVLSRAVHSHDRGDADDPFELIFLKAFKLYWILSLPIMIFVFYYAEPLITLIFTQAFASSGLCLKILIWGTFFVFSELLMSHALIAQGKQKALYIANGTCLAVNLGVDYLLIMHFKMGAVGASIGTLSAYSALFLILFYHLRGSIRLMEIIKLLPKPFLAAALAFGMSYFLLGLSWYRVIPLGLTVYGMGLILLKTFSRDEIDLFKKMLRPPGPPPGEI